MTRVIVSAKGNPWDVGATSSLSKPIEAGDAILVAIYLRAPALKDGESTPVTYFGINETSAPYTSVVRGSAEVTNQWKVFYASGQAAKALAPNQAAPGMHLSAAKHVLELGPVLVYNYGKNMDPAKLPTPLALVDVPAASSAPAKRESKLVGQLINDLKPATWNIYGAHQSNESIMQAGQHRRELALHGLQQRLQRRRFAAQAAMRAISSCFVQPGAQVSCGCSPTLNSMCEGVNGSVPSSFRPSFVTNPIAARGPTSIPRTAPKLSIDPP